MNFRLSKTEFWAKVIGLVLSLGPEIDYTKTKPLPLQRLPLNVPPHILRNLAN